MPHGRRLAVHQTGGRANDFTAENLADALMPHAHAENPKLWPELGAGLKGDSRIFGTSRTGGYHDAARVHASDLIHGFLVILIHHVFAPAIAEVLREVIGEAIVVVDDYHRAVRARGGERGASWTRRERRRVEPSSLITMLVLTFTTLRRCASHRPSHRRRRHGTR